MEGVPHGGCKHDAIPLLREILDALLRANPRPKLPMNPKFGDLEDYWTHFDAVAKEETAEMMRGLKGSLDNLLLFAALFSALNASFLTFTLPMLRDDPSSGTNVLLNLLVQGVDKSSLKPSDLVPPPFIPSDSAIRINTLVSVSLTLSLLVSFWALLTQYWIVHYTGPTPGASDGGRWDRERRFEGAQQWYLQGIVKLLLPILILAALFAFTIGFMTFLQTLGWSIAFPNLVLATIGVTAFIASTLVSAWDPFCPFQTPFTTMTLAAIEFGRVAPLILWTRNAFSLIIERLPRRIPWVRPEFTGIGPQPRPGLLRRALADGTSWWKTFDSRATAAFQSIRRPKENIDVLQDRAAARVFETSGHFLLLRATAINISLPSNKPEKSDSQEYTDSRLRRLISLFRLAQRHNIQEEQLAYAQAVVYLLLTEEKLSMHSIPHDISEVYITGSVQAYHQALQNYLPETLPGVVTAALPCMSAYSHSSSGSEAAKRCIRLIRRLVAQDQLSPLPACMVLIWMMAILSESSNPATPVTGNEELGYPLPEDEPRTFYDWARINPCENPSNLNFLLDVMRPNAPEKLDRAIDLASKVFRGYDRQSEILHELAIGIVKLLGKALESKDAGITVFLLPWSIEGFFYLFASPRTLADENTDDTINRLEEALDVAVELVLTSVAKTGICPTPWALRLLIGYVAVAERRRESGQCDLALGERFVGVVWGVYRQTDLVKDTRGGVNEFRRAIAWLPEHVLRLPDELRRWVDEAPKVEGSA